MKLYLIRYGIYYECIQVSKYVYSTRMGHVHIGNDSSPVFQIFTEQWEALRFMYQYHSTYRHSFFYRGITDSRYRLPYTLDYVKRNLISKYPEDFL